MTQTAQSNRDQPSFASQAEEDAFWSKQHAEIEARALEAFANGTVGTGRAARQLAELRANREAQANLIHLEPADAARAAQLAAKNGLEYQTYVRKLIHEALQRELSLVQ